MLPTRYAMFIVAAVMLREVDDAAISPPPILLTMNYATTCSPDVEICRLRHYDTAAPHYHAIIV